MPDAEGFLDGFGFILGSQLLGGLIVKVHGGHKAIVRWHQYEYPIEMMIAFSEPINSDAKMAELSTVTSPRVIYSDKNMPYQSIIRHAQITGVYTGPDQNGHQYTWITFKLDGYAKRLYKKDMNS